MKLTLIELAREVGVDPGQMSKIERGRMVTLSPNVQKICTYLKVEIAPRHSETDAFSPLAARLACLFVGSRISEHAMSKLVAALEDVADELVKKFPSD